MTSRRILHVYKDFAPDRGGGGVARHIDGLAVVAAGQGHVLRIVAPQAEPAAGAPYATVRAGIAGLWPHIGWADIVHVHGARTPIAAAAALLARIRGKRVVYTPHCYYDTDAGTMRRLAKRLWDRLIERRLLAGSDAVVLLAEFWLHLLARRGLPVRRPALLPNCVLAARLQPAPSSGPPGGRPLEGRPAILSVGRLDPVKRLDDAVRALAEPGLEQGVLHIVGLGPERQRLEAHARAAGVAERVRLLGFVPDGEVAALATAADVFVLPSAAEGMPTVLIEMLLHGCAVVASDIPGNRAVVDLAGAGHRLHPVGDVAALAACIRAAAGRRPDPAAAARIRAELTWEAMGDRIRALYDGVFA